MSRFHKEEVCVCLGTFFFTFQGWIYIRCLDQACTFGVLNHASFRMAGWSWTVQLDSFEMKPNQKMFSASTANVLQLVMGPLPRKQPFTFLRCATKFVLFQVHFCWKMLSYHSMQERKIQRSCSRKNHHLASGTVKNMCN